MVHHAQCHYVHCHLFDFRGGTMYVTWMKPTTTFIFIVALWLFFTQIQLGGMSNLILGLSYLVACFLYFYPIITLYSFGKKMRMAMLQNDQVLMNQSLKKLKNCFLYIGITTIILIATYGIIAIAGLVFYASSI